MPELRVVLVEPKNEGNVGAVARAMKNFEVSELVLVRPCALGEEARKRAMHGIDVLESARQEDRFGDSVRGADLVVGTSGIDTASEKRFARIAIRPRELAIRVGASKGLVAIAFGREDFGLFDEELARCDLLVTIPASPAYPILNVSHAVSIVLYELFAGMTPPKGTRQASDLEKEKLHEAFDALMSVTEYPQHKRERTRVMFRRMIGRAVPSTWEFHALMGVFQRATKRIRRLETKR
jgi:tRNA/rRNA methyltransferase